MPAPCWCHYTDDDLILVMPLAVRPALGRRPGPEHFQPGHDIRSEFCPCAPRLEQDPGCAPLLIHNDLERPQIGPI